MLGKEKEEGLYEGKAEESDEQEKEEPNIQGERLEASHSSRLGRLAKQRLLLKHGKISTGRKDSFQ